MSMIRIIATAMLLFNPLCISKAKALAIHDSIKDMEAQNLECELKKRNVGGTNATTVIQKNTNGIGVK